MEITMESVAKAAGLKPVKTLKDLGYANGWQYGGGTPSIVKWCQAEGHKLEGKVIGKCLVERKCPICGYVYKVDSSG